MRVAGGSARNTRVVDPWSWTHLAWGVALGWLLAPFWALLILVLWEPLEVFILSPLSWRLFQREFGHESMRNSVSDIVFDAAGVALGAWGLRAVLDPPFVLG
jgi:hypothetical protein